MKNMYQNIIKEIANNIKTSLIKEGIFTENNFDDYEEENNSFNEYVNNYNNDSLFNPNNLTKRDLINFCQNSGDFFIIMNNTFRGGLKFYTISTEDQKTAVIDDLSNAEISLTHEVDYLIEDKLNFDSDYIAVFYVKPRNNEPFYFVYEQFKNGSYGQYDENVKQKRILKISKSDLNKMIQESIRKMI